MSILDVDFSARLPCLPGRGCTSLCSIHRVFLDTYVYQACHVFLDVAALLLRGGGGCTAGESVILIGHSCGFMVAGLSLVLESDLTNNSMF